ncbi:MAG: 4-(cytidine 5'-diphospho)-2-C-methyl-D-erythritol kinase [Candidatus Omnitrophota bacterium]
MDKLILNSYAKLNLYLLVLNKRPDKHHNINTLFEKISLCDKITLQNRSDAKIRIISSSPCLPKDYTQNLAYLAAQLLQNTYALSRGVDISIIKNIPVGAGLGGGSSNAATVLLGLNKLWGLRLSRVKLIRLAKELGSDVAFFLYDTPFALGENKGDKIRELKALKNTRLWHILIVPKIRVSTPSIYKGWDRLLASGETSKRVGLTRARYDVKMLILAIKKKDLSLISPKMFNGLQQVTTKVYPAVGRIIKALRSLGLGAILMSGSGPAVFAIIPSRKEAANLSRRLKAEDKQRRVFFVRTAV